MSYHKIHVMTHDQWISLTFDTTSSYDLWNQDKVVKDEAELSYLLLPQLSYIQSTIIILMLN